MKLADGDMATDIPTLEETGVSGYESLSWSGIVAPAAGTGVAAPRSSRM